jgi:hypothetical protein
MKKSNLLALVAGMSVAVFAAGCGKATTPASISPIQQAQDQDMVEKGAPEGDGNDSLNGLDGEWIRKDNATVCDTGGVKGSVESFSFRINNTDVKAVIRYYEPGKTAGDVRAIVVVPLTFAYSASAVPAVAGATAVPGTSSGQINVTTKGPGTCEYVDNTPCKGDFSVSPIMPNVITYTKTGDTPIFKIDKDTLCGGGSSMATLTRETTK